MMTKILYKYRDLDNFKYFVDILLNNRLYAAKYKDLNDPMEGHYYNINGRLNRDIRDKLLEEKGEFRLCSLSKIKDNQLMWSHYAKGHRGVAIGLRVNENQFKVKPIQYDGLTSICNEDYNHQTAIDILSHKLEVWNYEEEVRVFVKDKNFIDVCIEEVITGVNITESDFNLVDQLVKKINRSIRIIKANDFINI